MSADFTSDVVETKLQDNIGIQLKWSGTPTGVFSFQISMNYVKDSLGNVLNAGDWVNLVLDPIILANGIADNAYIDFNQLSAPWLRVVYTATSGSGSLDGWADGKGV